MNTINDLRLALYQADICWEEINANLEQTEAAIAQIAGQNDLLVLPEMFTTGFSMEPERLAETNDGITVTQVTRWSREYRMAIAGSFIATDHGNRFYNRAFFITPEGEQHFYDKHHLFSIGSESRHFSAGNRQLIVPYRGWNICPMICYDLRFPVWSRNRNNAYDLLLFMANWPQSRAHAWSSLLVARAIENVAYVAGVNRVGDDQTSGHYRGDTVILDQKGFPLAGTESDQSGFCRAVLRLDELKRFREKFPTWRDADPFTLSV